MLSSGVENILEAEIVPRKITCDIKDLFKQTFHNQEKKKTGYHHTDRKHMLFGEASGKEVNVQ